MYLKDSNSKCISFDNNQNVTKLKKLFRRRCFDFCALLTIIYYVMSTNSWLCTDYSVVQSKVMFFESANKLTEYQKICKEKTHEYWKEKKRRLHWILSLQRSSQICCRKRLKSSVVIFNAWARKNLTCFKLFSWFVYAAHCLSSSFKTQRFFLQLWKKTMTRKHLICLSAQTYTVFHRIQRDRSTLMIWRSSVCQKKLLACA